MLVSLTTYLSLFVTQFETVIDNKSWSQSYKTFYIFEVKFLFTIVMYVNPSVVYFDKLLGAARTQKLAETFISAWVDRK